MESKKWVKGTCLAFLAVALATAGITLFSDPYFHYHKPIGNYRLREARYINNGIAKQFDYNAVLIGTSMTGNFSTEEYDELFGTESIKLTIPGASYREISMQLERALEYNPEIQEVFISLDLDRITMDWDWMKDYELPEWLYDDALYNDAPYLLNKSILLHDVMGNILLNITGGDSTSMDEWGSQYGDIGLEAVLADYEEVTDKYENRHIIDEEEKRVQESIQKNFSLLIEQYPEVTFRFFVPPYSIYYWNECYDRGLATISLDAEAVAIEELLKYSNVEIYCFYEEGKFLDTSFYHDTIHFSKEYASHILKCIKSGENMITEENLSDHTKQVEEVILNYPYDTLQKE